MGGGGGYGDIATAEGGIEKYVERELKIIVPPLLFIKGLVFVTLLAEDISSCIAIILPLSIGWYVCFQRQFFHAPRCRLWKNIQYTVEP